jgi:ABC-type multidrug transport system fused ATPase/permease subunit
VRLRGLRLCGADGEAREVLILDLPPGAQVALLGGPGVGRRRLLDALRGLREPLSGSIELGGVDLRDLDVLGLREVCALVGGVEVLADTVHANVALGRALDKAQVRDLLEQVGLGGLINRLPRGTETALTCDGEPLERVELILLNLARAIAGRPRLLLIDRALDALPPAARRLVLRLLLAQDAAWTLIVATDLDDVAAALPRAVRVGAPASKALTATGTPLLEAQ